MIRNIIFDYGGVIIDLDYTRPKQEFEKLGIKNFDEIFTRFSQAPFFDLLDRGKLSERDFRKEICNQAGIAIADEQIDHAWNSMLIGIPEYKIHFLQHLYADHKTFLLSNTNFIHLKYITKYLLRTYGRVNLDSVFNRVYYSCSMGIRKPATEVFQKVLEDNSLKPRETLYIDDTSSNLEGAIKAGINAVLYDPKDSLEEFVNNILKQESGAA